MADPFVSEGKAGVVKGLTAGDLESTDVKVFGTFTPTLEVTGPLKVGGDPVLVGPLGFTMSGCTPNVPPNAAPGSCNGGGVIRPASKAAHGLKLPALRVGDEGQCFGICVTTQVPPTPTPAVCTLKVAESGQAAAAAGGARTRRKSGKKKVQEKEQATAVEASPPPPPPMPQLPGALVLVLGPGFRSMEGFDWKHATCGWIPLERGLIHLGKAEVPNSIQVRWRPGYRAPASVAVPARPDLSAWRALVNFVPDASARNAISRRGEGWAVLRIHEDGIGSVSLDLYEVVILRRPARPPFREPSELLSAIRLRLNEMVDTTYAEFHPYDSGEDQKRWTGNRTLDAVGAAVHIDVLGPIDGTVVVSGASAEPAYFRFTTMRSPKDPMHPVSGNREFGVRVEGARWTVYTRGADRLSNRAPVPELVVRIGAKQTHERVVSLVGEGGFLVADRLWRSFQTRVAEWIRREGGEAEVRPPTSNRYDWDETRRQLRP